MSRLKIETISKSSNPVVVSTLTPLMAFTDLFNYQNIIFAVQNVDVTNPVTVFFETSEDGVSVDSNLIYSYVIQPGQQCSLEVGPDQMRSYYSVSAQTASPSYPNANVTFVVRAGMSADWVSNLA